MPNSTTTLDIRTDGPIERVQLNRPDVRNAFDEHVIADLTTWAERQAAGSAARVAVLSGAGPVFCAGADIGWMAKAVSYTYGDNRRDAEALSRMFEALDQIRIPLIGRIQGAALGGGAGLAAVCDMVVAAEDAVFGFTEVRLGILPAVVAPYALRKIGISAARELFLTGLRLPAARALELGLVHRVVPTADLDRTIDEYVSAVLSSGPESVAAAKALIAEVAGRSPSDVISITAAAIAAQRVSVEGQEGLRAFLERRRPSWLA